MNDTHIRKAHRFVSLTELYIEQGQALMAGNVMDSREIHDAMMHIDKFKIELEKNIKKAEEDLERQQSLALEFRKESSNESSTGEEFVSIPIDGSPNAFPPDNVPDPGTPSEPAQAALDTTKADDSFEESRAVAQEFARMPGSLDDAVSKSDFDPVEAQASSV
jgi:hypothetical protein